MKRLILLFLALATVIGMCACGDSSIKNEDTAAAAETEAAPVVESLWSVDHYVDEFGDKTDEGYIRTKVNGTFSNSAVNSADLDVVVYYFPDSDDMFGFRLLEYGKMNATIGKNDLVNLSLKIDKKTYAIQCMVTANDVFLTKAFRSEDDGLKRDNKTPRAEVYDAFYNAILNGETVSCAMYIGDYLDISYQSGCNVYRFKVDGTGFADTLAEFK